MTASETITISIRAPVDITRPSADAELIQAADAGDLERVKRAIADGGDIEAYTSDWNTVVLTAALGNPRKEVSEHLVNCGANLLATNDEGGTLLHAFAARGWVDLMERSIDAGCDIDASTIYCDSPLSIAGDRLDVVGTLIRRGASPFRRGVSGSLTINFDSVDQLNAALAAGLSINSRAANGATLLMLAAEVDDLPLCSALLSSGVDIDAVDDSGIPAIGYAASSGAPGCFALLLDAGAGIDYRNRNGTGFDDMLRVCTNEVVAVHDAWQARQVMMRVSGPMRSEKL
jgi:ankyrin repeat protein